MTVLHIDHQAGKVRAFADGHEIPCVVDATSTHRAGASPTVTLELLVREVRHGHPPAAPRVSVSFVDPDESTIHSPGHAVGFLMAEGERIWGDADEPVDLDEAIRLLLAPLGDLAKMARDGTSDEDEARELGNLALTALRMAARRGLGPDQVAQVALEAQREWARRGGPAGGTVTP